MARSQDQVLRGILADLPPGWAFPKGESSTFGRLLSPLTGELSALEASMEALLEEADPRSTVLVLAEWERAFGLPDPCMPLNPTLEQRRRALLVRLAEQGGQSRAYFIGLAGALGYAITIEEPRPFRFGAGRFGQPMYGEAWAHAWRVLAPDVAATPFRFGRSAFGERLRTWGNDQLECVLRRASPAHSVLLFGAYQAEWDIGTALPAGATLRRASPAAMIGPTGALVEVAADVARWDYDAALPLNLVPNPWGDGGTIGGALPTGWAISGGNGLTATLAGKGTLADGTPYVDVRLAGTTTGPVNTWIHVVAPSASPAVPAVPGDTVAADCGVALLSFAQTSAATIRPTLHGMNAAASSGDFSVGSNMSVGGTMTRFRQTKTFAVAGTIGAGVGFQLYNNVAGNVIDLVVRIASPTLVRGTAYLTDLASLPDLMARDGTRPLYGLRGLLIEPADPPRAADVLMLDVPDGTYDAEIVGGTVSAAGVVYAGSLVAVGGRGAAFAWPAAAIAAGERHLQRILLKRV